MFDFLKDENKPRIYIKWEKRNRKEYLSNYQKSEQGKIKAKKYNQSEKGKATLKRCADKPKGRYSKTKAVAKSRGLEFDISFDEFMSFWQKPCFYCKNEMQAIGLDRIDNNIGYHITNIVSCCICCNIMKSTKTVKEFLEQIIKINQNIPNILKNLGEIL